MKEKICINCGSDDIIKTGKEVCFPFIHILCSFCDIEYGAWDEVEYSK